MFNLYIPTVSTTSHAVKKGIGLAYEHTIVEDVDTLNCKKYYNWWVTPSLLEDERYVPMLWNGTIRTDLPREFNREILFLNEPDSPSQSNVTPANAFIRYIKAREYYINASIIAGGVSSLSEYWGWTHWLEEFVNLFHKNNEPLPEGFHSHGYVEYFVESQYNTTVAGLISLWGKQLELISPRKLWVTEYNDTQGNLNNFRTLTEYLLGNKDIEYIFPFTNRMDGTESWIPSGWNYEKMKLIGTEIGDYYKGVK